MTTVVATHDASVAASASRVIEMRDGKVVADSAPLAAGEPAPAAATG